MAGTLILFLFIFCSFSVLKCNPGRFTTKIGPLPIWNSTFTDKLRQDLLFNYDKFARPAQHNNKTIVKLGLIIRHTELNEFKSTLTVHSFVQMSWNDEKLKWNASHYGGIKKINLADHEIWLPDIFLYNSATSTGISHYITHCIVNPEGQVFWVPPVQLTVLCKLNLKYWPFDSQQCHLKFISWTYSGDQIDLQLMNNDTDEAQVELEVPNSEWELVSTKMVRNQVYLLEEPYVDIDVILNLKRYSPSYRALIITPACVIMVLILVIFWLPPQCGEKILLNCSTAIIICLFLLFFSQKVPTMGTHTPLIVLFFTSCLYIVSMSMIESVIVIWLSRNIHNNPLPWSLKKVLTGTFGKLLGLNEYIKQSSMMSHKVTHEEMRDHQVTDFDEQTEDEHRMIRSLKNNQKDWILLAAAIDRLSFCFYCLLFTILSIMYSL